MMMAVVVATVVSEVSPSSSFQESVLSLYRRGKFFDASVASVRGAWAGYDAALAPLPLRLELGVGAQVPVYGDKAETLSRQIPPLAHAESASGAVALQHLSSLTNTLRASYGRNNYTTDTKQLAGNTVEVTNTLDYDVLRGGRSATAALESRRQAEGYRAQALRATEAVNSDFLQFYQVVMSWMAGTCKLASIAPMEAVIRSAAQKGRALVNVNAISRKEFQNYQGAVLSWEQSRLALQNRLAELELAMEGWGPELASAVRSRLKEGLCEQRLPQESELVPKGGEPGSSLRVAVATAELEQVRASLALARQRMGSSLKPYVEASVLHTEPQRAVDYRFMAGLKWTQDAFRYRAQGELDSQAAAARAQEITLQLEQQRVEAELRQLRGELRNALKLGAALQANVENTDLTLRILTAESALNKSDSLQFSGTVNQKVELTGALYDLVADLHVKAARLRLLTRAGLVLGEP